MLTVKTRVQIVDGRLEAKLPASVPSGEHEAVIVIDTAETPKPFDMSRFPIDDGPWDGSISLRREDMYGDDGR
ncbi:hypothetical protein ACFQI3_04630 [Hansschlegelia quercus]|uniref:Uncharacterized protein n=1 Tax=Hansschlegelia quercus TaxID=2528245 RepID=A0A4Q9GQS9_9HYPH|nr:hypothetical protein [Hansschlegelia quercus]TBN55164.1 hypothetical protein EYR15_03225 [Hansschlegelia quercus]